MFDAVELFRGYVTTVIILYDDVTKALKEHIVFVYVDDMSEAMHRLLENIDQKYGVRAVNACGFRIEDDVRCSDGG